MALLHGYARKVLKARRWDAQKAPTTARGFVGNDLKNFVVQAERSSRKMEAALDPLLALPDSPKLLRALALLRQIEAGNKDALAISQRQISNIGGDGAKAARQIVAEARGLTPEAFAAAAAPRIEIRCQELRSAYLSEAEARLASLPSGPQGFACLDSEFMGISDEPGEGLSAEEYAHLETLAQERRAAIRQEILDDAEAGSWSWSIHTRGACLYLGATSGATKRRSWLPRGNWRKRSVSSSPRPPFPSRPRLFEATSAPGARGLESAVSPARGERNRPCSPHDLVAVGKRHRKRTKGPHQPRSSAMPSSVTAYTKSH